VPAGAVAGRCGTRRGSAPRQQPPRLLELGCRAGRHPASLLALSNPPSHPQPQVREPSAVVEHEASTSKIGEDQLFYFQQRGVDVEDAVGVIISGFCREVFNELPLEFAAEVNELMSLKLEGSVG
jgi:hypothetical protein